MVSRRPHGVRALGAVLGLLLAVSAVEPPRSLLARSASLEPDDVSWLHEPAEAALHSGRHPVKYNRRRAEALTTENTAPIRIVVGARQKHWPVEPPPLPAQELATATVGSRPAPARLPLTCRGRLGADYGSLYEETAPAYSACFTVGAWFARGLPEGGLTPPEDGLETCARGADEWHSSDCWLRCAPADLITESGRAIVRAVVDSAVAEASTLFALQPVQDTLRFVHSGGRYQKVRTALVVCLSSSE